MALTKKTAVLATHVFFFRDGDAFTVPTAGTTARESKPGATDPAWVDLGIITDAEDSPLESEEIQIFAGTPGARRLWDILDTKTVSKGSVKCAELSPLALEVAYRTNKLTESSTQFNRLEGKRTKGWLKRQVYDGEDAQRIVEDLFVDLKIKSAIPMDGGKLAEVDFEYTVLHSTLNTGTL